MSGPKPLATDGLPANRANDHTKAAYADGRVARSSGAGGAASGYHPEEPEQEDGGDEVDRWLASSQSTQHSTTDVAPPPNAATQLLQSGQHWRGDPDLKRRFEPEKL